MDNDGVYRLCVQANTHRETRGVLTYGRGQEYEGRSHRLADIRNAPLLKDVRKSMLKGEVHPICERCNREDNLGLSSRRQLSRREIAGKHEAFALENLIRNTQADGTIDPEKFPIIEADVRLGNKCNLKCRSCYPGESSGWYEEWRTTRHHLFSTRNKKGVLLQLNDRGKVIAQGGEAFLWYEDSQFFKHLHEDAPKIKKIHCVGGEPLMIKEHYDMLEELIKENIAAHIELDYNSNLTMLPQRALELWAHFKGVYIGVSIDGPEHVNDFIRFPSKFSEVIKNVTALKALPNVHLWFTLTVMAYNILYIPDLLRWLLENNEGFSGRGNSLFFAFHPLYNPVYLKPSILPESVKKLARARYEDFQKHELDKLIEKSTLRDKDAGRIRATKILSSCLQLLQEPSNDRHLLEFWERTSVMDKYRGQSFEESFPELYGLVREYLTQAKLLT